MNANNMYIHNICRAYAFFKAIQAAIFHFILFVLSKVHGISVALTKVKGFKSYLCLWKFFCLLVSLLWKIKYRNLDCNDHIYTCNIHLAFPWFLHLKCHLWISGDLQRIFQISSPDFLCQRICKKKNIFKRGLFFSISYAVYCMYWVCCFKM